MSRLALAIIAKDEVEAVKSIIEKYGEYFDEIAIAHDERHEEFEGLGGDKVRTFRYEWCNNFAHKRNFLAERVESPYYFRLDTDDEIGNPQAIPQLFTQIVSHDFDVFYTPYDYAKDEHGNVIARHWRETIIKKRDDVYWKKEIHENVFMENLDSCKLSRDESLRIIHNTSGTHAIDSFNRNYEYLLTEFKRDGKDCDPRTVAYLGRMMMGQGHWEKATFFLQSLIKNSGWDDDKYFAYVQMAQCYQQINQMDTAIACCNEALAINTKFPDAYIQLGMIYLQMEDYEKAVDWVMPGIVRKEPDTVMVLDPTFYTLNAKMTAALALLGKGDIDTAVKYFNEVRAKHPNNPKVIKYEPIFADVLQLRNFVKNFSWLCMYVKEKEPKKLKSLLDSIPSHAYRDERVWQIRHAFGKARRWGTDEVAIYCGPCWEEWSPVSTLKGIGGSEEAVIYLSKELTKLGWRVTVFNNCGSMAGEYEGVIYAPYQAFNPRDTYNILVGWRGNYLKGVEASRKIVWLHDVPYDGMFTKENVKDFDKVVVLSDFHRSLLPSFVPHEKVFVSSNGINLPDFNTPSPIRNPHRIIYTSSYDRGLEHLLGIWAEVRHEVPDAELHIFYGWNVYDEMVKVGRRDGKFKEAMVRLMNQEGIFEHGRVGHKQLVKELKQSSIWAYPSHFEEISCISAMKAQACGAIPVCTDYAALTETVKNGVKVPGKAGEDNVTMRFKKELISLLKDEKRQEEIRGKLSGSSFSWENVAKLWSGELFTKAGEE